MSISQVTAVKTQINPTVTGRFYLAVLKTCTGLLLPEPRYRVHQIGINCKADIKIYHMMKDFPMCTVQWAALNPVHVRVYARVCACCCLFKPFSFTERHSLRLLQAFPRKVNLRGEKELSLNLIFLKASFWRKKVQVEWAETVKTLQLTTFFKRRQNPCSFLVQALIARIRSKFVEKRLFFLQKCLVLLFCSAVT